MKIKKDIVLVGLGDAKMAVPVGKTADEIKGIIRLNETASFIWNCVNEGLEKEQIARKMVESYSNVDFDTAMKCTEEIIEQMLKDGVIEEE